MHVKYVGRFDAVDVPALNREVKRGETVEVSDEVGSSLVEQQDNWQQVKPVKSGSD